MDAKTMLNQALDIHYEIMVKQEQISAIQDSIMSLSVPLDQEKVTMTADPSYMQTVIAQQMQFENELKEDIVRLTVVKQKIVKIINQIDNVKARLVLSKHYLGLKPWNVIAKEMGISRKWVLNLQTLGTEQIDRILAEGEDEETSPDSSQSFSGEKLTLSVQEAADLIGISKPKMFELLRSGEIPCKRIGKKILISHQMLVDWINQ